MRNIIFRGKRINRNGEWGYGDLRRFGGNTWVFPHDKDAAYDADMVDPETVGEFTGIVDENGKRIFEGDIVKGEWFYDKEMSPHPVCFHERQLQWVIRLPNCVIPFYEMETIEVVGNIYDNPELLKQE